MDNYKSIFAQRLQYLLENRTEYGKKVPNAKQATEMGINPDTLRGYLHSEPNPTADTLILISRYYKVSIDYLLGITNTPAHSYACHRCGIRDNNKRIIEWLVNNKDRNKDAAQTLDIINRLLPEIDIWKALYQYVINKEPFYLDEDETTEVKQLYRGGIQNAQNLRQSYLMLLFQYLNDVAEGRHIEYHYEPT